MSEANDCGARGLHRLIYVSRQAVDASERLDEAVDAIVRASIRNNRQVAVTGLLLVHNGWFVQALEGPRAAVRATYGRILDDPRHSDARLVADAPADFRAFADWNMCARRMSDADEVILDSLAQRQAFDPPRLNARSALRLLTAVRNVQARAVLI